MDYQKGNKVIPCYAHESALAIAERTIKRLWITCMVLIALIVVTNVMWIWHNNQFEDVTTEVYNEAHVAPLPKAKTLEAQSMST